MLGWDPQKCVPCWLGVLVGHGAHGAVLAAHCLLKQCSDIVASPGTKTGNSSSNTSSCLLQNSPMHTAASVGQQGTLMHTHTHMRAHTYTQTCMNTHIHTHAHIHTHTHIYIVCKHTHTYKHTHTHTYTRVHANAYRRAHAYAQTHLHTRTHRLTHAHMHVRVAQTVHDGLRQLFSNASNAPPLVQA